MQKLIRRIENLELKHLPGMALYVAIMDTRNTVVVTGEQTNERFTRDEYDTWKRRNAITDNQLLEVQIVNERKTQTT